MQQLLRHHPQLIFFGLLATLFSGPGQTFLVSLFIPEMRDAFGLSQAGIASIYATATLVSAFLLPWLGRLLDRMHLILFTSIAAALLAGGCITLGLSQGTLTLFCGFLLVRNLGQGTLTMISSTTIARLFGDARGKALSLTNLGFPLSEAIFPFAVTHWLEHYGWRSAWFFLAALIAGFFIPAVLLLLRRSPHKEIDPIDQAIDQTAVTELEAIRQWTSKEMLRDKRFYALMLPTLIPPGFLTGLFFHHGALIQWKGWDLSIISLAFLAYAACRGAMSFLIGPLVDRFSAKRLLPFCLLPFAGGIAGMIYGPNQLWAVAIFVGGGLTVGLTMTVKGALWAELYGTEHLGSIRGIQGSLSVFITAVTPPLMGLLLDAQINPALILSGMIGLIFGGSILAWWAGQVRT